MPFLIPFPYLHILNFPLLISFPYSKIANCTKKLSQIEMIYFNV